MKQIIFTLIAVLAALVPSTMSAYDFEVDGIYYKLESDGVIINDGNEVTVTYETTSYNSYTGDVIIPAEVTYNGTTYSVTEIGNQAFCKCSGLTSVTIPNTVTYIGFEAFDGCSGLTHITIPNSVKTISVMAFRGCTGLTYFDIPNSVETIGSDAFYGCTGLTSIYIPTSVRDMGNSFSGCTNLTSIKVSCDNERYDSRDNCNGIIHTASNYLIQGCKTTIIPNTVTAISGAFAECSELAHIEIPNSVTMIVECAFLECTGLDNIVIPNSVTVIGWAAFYECTGLTSINIPNSVTEIGSWAFCGCTRVTSVTIGNSVSSIGEDAFNGLSKLDRVVCQATTPPDIYYAFSFSSYEIATLFVPAESIEAYRDHEEWGQFMRIVPFRGAGPGDINGDGNIAVSDVTNLIDQLLSGDELPAYADVNGDGVVTIKDVTDLIDMLLNGN